MSVNVRELSSLALGLPVRSRAILADLLLDSLDEGSAESHDSAWLELAKSRDAEMERTATTGGSHEELLAAARKAVRCAR